MAAIAPVLAEKVEAATQVRAPSILGVARARRNVAVHRFDAPFATLAINAKKEQRGTRNAKGDEQQFGSTAKAQQAAQAKAEHDHLVHKPAAMIEPIDEAVDQANGMETKAHEFNVGVGVNCEKDEKDNHDKTTSVE